MIHFPMAFLQARNLPHSGYASMDDGLSDKHPGW